MERQGQYMKYLLFAFLLFPGLAFSQTTIRLPLPTIAQLDPQIPKASCPWTYYAHPFTIVTGFDSTGNYVQGTANNVAKCGGSGRINGIHYYPYCASFVWDLSGNLVSTVVGTCTQAVPEYYSNGTYEAYTFVQYDYGYLQYEYPLLVTP
jgi:hypothetical protein